MEKENRLGALLSRKFIFAILISVGLFILAFIDKISYENLQDGLLWALAIFSASNVGQKIVKASK